MSDKLIFNCADRMTKKSSTSRCLMNNGEFPKEVQKEIERMKHHCTKEIKKKIRFVEAKLRIAEEMVDFELHTEPECRYEEVKL